jgi:hypothetical protein
MLKTYVMNTIKFNDLNIMHVKNICHEYNKIYRTIKYWPNHCKIIVM